MKVPLSWLGELVELTMPVPELARRLTMAGLEVEEVHVVGAGWRDVTVARVVELERHPRRESLSVARLDLGGRETTVVTGATNLRVGDVVPHVAPGGQLPNGDVGAREFGGITSQGMVCSGDELDISPDKDGIYVFEPSATVGQPVADYLGETILDVYIGANRPDCMSLVGLAREVHTLFDAPYKPALLRLLDPASATVAGSPGEPPASALLSIRIDDPQGCPRFTASIVRGINIGPSPQWLQRRLHFAGVRPISNVVDVTNYVMLEVGQPLHAFDHAQLGSNSIVVRRAAEGEVLRTLDGDERVLSSTMMVVTDGQRARSLAGIMGGEDSEIADFTRDVVLEGANWDRATIRLTSSALNLSSEASRRFGRGVDPDLTALGVARATHLTLELAGGAAAAGLIDVYPGRSPAQVISLPSGYVARLMGMHYASEQIEHTLDSLGFGVAPANEGWTVTVPGWRRFDVEGRADLAEEVARVAGYEQLPATMLRGSLPEPRPDGDAGYSDELRARRTLAAAGPQEVITYSLVDPDQNARLSADPAAAPPEPAIAIANPQSSEHSVLRTTLLGGILAPVRNNLRQRERVLVFELGHTWHGELNPLPDERRNVGIAIAGRRVPEHFSSGSAPFDFFDLKGIVDLLCGAFGVVATYAPARHPSLHPGRAAEVCSAGERFGMLGQLHPIVAERYDLESQPVFVAEIDFDRLLRARQAHIIASTPSRFPPADRDIAIVVDEDTSHADVEAAIREAAQPLLEQVRLFDIYRREPIPPGRKSMAFSLRYRAADRTLADDEVAASHARVEEALRARFRGEVRGR